MPELEIALLLHPVDEVGIFLDVDPEQLFFYLGFLDDNEFPRLAVGARHRPASNLENLVHILVRDRVRLELAYAYAIAYELQQRVVIAEKVGLVHRVPSAGRAKGANFERFTLADISG